MIPENATTDNTPSHLNMPERIHCIETSFNLRVDPNYVGKGLPIRWEREMVPRGFMGLTMGAINDSSEYIRKRLQRESPFKVFSDQADFGMVVERPIPENFAYHGLPYKKEEFNSEFYENNPMKVLTEEETKQIFLKDACMTYPNIVMEHIGDWTFFALDLKGICNCGKPYSKHPEYVAENEKRRKDMLRKISENNKAHLDLHKSTTFMSHTNWLHKTLKKWEAFRSEITNKPAPEPKCECTFAQKMVGDGCSICNPQSYEAEWWRPYQTLYTKYNGCDVVLVRNGPDNWSVMPLMMADDIGAGCGMSLPFGDQEIKETFKITDKATFDEDWLALNDTL
jgi:hypothetical protein